MESNDATIQMLFVYPNLSQNENIYCCDSSGFKKVTTVSEKMAIHISNSSPMHFTALCREVLDLREKLKIAREAFEEVLTLDDQGMSLGARSHSLDLAVHFSQRALAKIGGGE